HRPNTRNPTFRSRHGFIRNSCEKTMRPTERFGRVCGQPTTTFLSRVAEGPARRRHGKPNVVQVQEESTMKRIVSFFAVLLAVAIATPAGAQIQTGSILVRATDEQGAVVPGVTITISSPVLVAGSMTGVTDAGGVNRFPSLVPGTYVVKIELAGFQTIIRENIQVLVGPTT